MNPTITTTHGEVRGVEENSLAIFRGIPYAAPPVGDLRFRAPAPAAAWDGVRDATKFGSACPQPTQATAIFSTPLASLGIEFSEDCLYLNVWTPAADDAKRPVMVWIHGGAFRTGTGAAPTYEGSNLAKRGDVVVVTLNYRLGALGFLYLPELGGANFGIQDQVAALRWVQDNIARFGGDPDNVTIFGESAGGKSVETLLATPAAAGLFRRAIAQSTYAPPMDAEGATTYAESLLGLLGVRRGDVERLRSIPVDEILQAQDRLQQQGMAAGSDRAWAPVVDGDTLPVVPIEAVAGGAIRDLDLIVGTTLDESRLFGANMPGIRDLDEAGLNQRLTAIFTGHSADPTAAAADMIAMYRRTREARGAGTQPFDIWFAFSTDHLFRQHSIQLAEAQSRQQPNTYMYLFTWPSPAFGGILGSCHAIELPFVFGNFTGPFGQFAGDSPEARTLSERIMDAWLAFARTGNPNHDGLPRWDPYSEAERQTMVLDRDPDLASAPLEEERRHWADLSKVSAAS